jgi:flagellar basal-body rod protein FlgB
MALTDLTIFSALAQKMRWHQARQGLLAENVANADTPGYRARDLKPFNFEAALGSAPGSDLRMAATEPGHIGAGASGSGPLKAQSTYGYEVTPDRNAVGIEAQMMQVAGRSG